MTPIQQAIKAMEAARQHLIQLGYDGSSSGLDAALSRLKKEDGWQPIEDIAPHHRCIVAGWQEPRNGVAGYWWWDEDDSDEYGKPVTHPDATLFMTISLPNHPEVKND
ncbi:hypothetical protein FF098_014620 [Parvularcula flava]|uniref:Uncharacterized protein n=1 Tax=Aquisalinus luteolus TaxID=1566827 RepID=A0A8J3A3E8_9PROT|nr:hypothetical protein [Aquisalinus luteolus]NHK29151.1 hypothetical protein [Aquisalinus luteolus]GGI00149.1 hypothetical protein GCM10011355_27760 [Aquisalinus luteolus]